MLEGTILRQVVAKWKKFTNKESKYMPFPNGH